MKGKKVKELIKKLSVKTTAMVLASALVIGGSVWVEYQNRTPIPELVTFVDSEGTVSIVEEEVPLATPKVTVSTKTSKKTKKIKMKKASKKTYSKTKTNKKTTTKKSSTSKATTTTKTVTATNVVNKYKKGSKINTQVTTVKTTITKTVVSKDTTKKTSTSTTSTTKTQTSTSSSTGTTKTSTANTSTANTSTSNTNTTNTSTSNTGTANTGSSNTGTSVKNTSGTTASTEPYSTTIEATAPNVDTRVVSAYNALGFKVEVNPKVSYSGLFDARTRTITLKAVDDTVYHELGHFVAFIAGNVDTSAAFQKIYAAEKSKYTAFNKAYVLSNSSEYFAESFKNYTLNPAELEKSRPQTYAAIKAALDTITSDHVKRIATVYKSVWK